MAQWLEIDEQPLETLRNEARRNDEEYRNNRRMLINLETKGMFDGLNSQQRERFEKQIGMSAKQFERVFEDLSNSDLGVLLSKTSAPKFLNKDYSADSERKQISGFEALIN